MSQKNVVKRTNFLINPKYQYSILGYFFILLVVNIAILLYTIHESNNRLVEAIEKLNLPKSHYFWSFVAEHQFFTMIEIICISIFMLCIFFAVGLFKSIELSNTELENKLYIKLFCGVLVLSSCCCAYFTFLTNINFFGYVLITFHMSL